VRITVQLLNARQDRHLWAHTYQVSENDIVALQDTVAHDVATQVAAKLKPTSTAGSSATTEQHVSFPAYEDYLRGRYFWNKRTADTATTAVEYFERAIAAEPRYALAYAGLADAYLEIYGFRLMSKQEGLTKAKTAALRALELDPSLAAAHTTLASIAFAGWDWTNAEREFKQAISLSPGYATAHEWYSIFLSTVGRHDQALSEATQAAQLDPLSPMIHANIGLVLLMARRYEEAAILLRRVVETTPEIGAPHLWLAVVYERQGRFAESAAEYERSAQLSQEPERSWIQGSAYAVAGKKIEAERMLSKAETLAKQLGTPGTSVAFAYLDLQLGKNEEAVEFLEKAYTDRDNDLADIKENLICDPLRAEPRFQEILRRMAFPER
jgi:tetratricopeptide (TPR) repeat protein